MKLPADYLRNSAGQPSGDRPCVFRLYISTERVVGGLPKLGHVGFSVEDEDGHRRYFDFGDVSNAAHESRLSRSFRLACGVVPVAGVAAVSGAALALTSAFTDSVPAVVVATYIGAVSGAVLGPGIGAVAESDMPRAMLPKMIRIPITREQHDTLLAKAQKRLTLYSTGFRNCVTYTADIMRACGIEAPEAWRSILCLPGAFGRKVEKLCL